MSQVAHGFHRSAAPCFRENVRGAKVFRHVEPRKACANVGIERDASKDMVSKQKDEVEEGISSSK